MRLGCLSSLQDLTAFKSLKSCLAYYRTKLFFEVLGTNYLKVRSTFTQGAQCACHISVVSQEVTGGNKPLHHHKLQMLNKLHRAKRKRIGQKKKGRFVLVKAREYNPNNAVNLPASQRLNIWPWIVLSLAASLKWRKQLCNWE